MVASAVSALVLTLGCMKTFAEAVDNYTPRKSVCPDETWATIAVQVRAAVKATVAEGTAKSAISHCSTLTGLLVWFLAQGHQEVDLSVALSGDSIEAYSETLERNRATLRSRLRRISKGNGYDPTPTRKAAVSRRDLQPPYSPQELDVLWAHAATLKNDAVRLAVRTSIALSAGCGFRVRDLITVDVTDVHVHPGRSGDDVLHVRANGRCVPVRPECVQWLQEVIAERREGLLIGPQSGNSAIRRSSQWVKPTPGVPAFSIFRLRSTWMCAQLVAGIGALELVARSGAGSLDGLDEYRKFVPAFDASCALDAGGVRGAVDDDAHAGEHGTEPGEQLDVRA